MLPCIARCAPQLDGVLTPGVGQVVGSFILRTMALSQPCVDLAVVMPAACFTDRDFKNYMYVPSLPAVLLATGCRLW